MKFLSELTSNARLKRLAYLNVFNALGFVILNSGLRLGVFPYLSRTLGPERFGDFLTTFSISTSIGFLAGNVLMTAMVRLHARFEQPQRQIFFNTVTFLIFVLNPLLALLFLAIVYGADGFFTKVDLTLFAIPLVLYQCTRFVEIMLNNVLGCQGRYVSKSIYDAAVGILCFLIFPIGYLFGKEAVVYWLAIAFGIVILGQTYQLFHLSGSIRSIKLGFMWSIFSIAPFYLATYSLDLLFQYGQRWLLAYFLDAESVSVFFVGTTVALMLMMGISMVSQLETLMISQRATVNDLRRSEVKMLVLFSIGLSVFLPLLAWLISTPVNTLLYGREMALRGVQVSYIVLPMLFFAPPLMVFRPVVVKFCSPKVPLIFSTVIACIAVGLGVLLIRRYGLPGAAWATTLTTFISSLLFGWKFTQEVLMPVYKRV